MSKEYEISEELLEKVFDKKSKDMPTIDIFCDYLGGEDYSGGGKVIKDFIRQIKGEPVQHMPDNIKWIRENCFFPWEAKETRNDVATESVKGKKEDTMTEKSYHMKRQDYNEVEFTSIWKEFEENRYKELNGWESEDAQAKQCNLYEGGIIEKKDNCLLFIEIEGFVPDYSQILMISDVGNTVYALGRLLPTEEEGQYYIIFDNPACIRYDKINKKSGKCRLVVKEQGNDKLYSLECYLSYKSFAVQEHKALCIDFGTSNTTAGCYAILDEEKDGPEVVSFLDVTADNTYVELLPTIVYVKDCSHEKPEEIEYLFGYEARKQLEEDNYMSSATVFFEIKRWITSLDEFETVYDVNHNEARVQRKLIIKAYLDYVIECAEQHFKSRFKMLHFSAPIKLKHKFLDELKRMYEKGDMPRKVLDGENSVDEGLAIVYNRIIQKVYKKKASQEKNKPDSIMILDCGGGTTDVASCCFSYETIGAGKRLKIETNFENGNSNFGGNNITYRIMQILKIKIAYALRPELIDEEANVIKLIDKNENMILTAVEKIYQVDKPEGRSLSYNSDEFVEGVYKKFVENYERAEKVIPTIFQEKKLDQEGRFQRPRDREIIKRNFYSLWRAAEQIKIEFYRTERVLMEFGKEHESKDIVLDLGENAYIHYVNEKERLEKKLNPLTDIEITIREIERAICGDIYGLLCGLFSGRKVDRFDYYKLSGQSCKISLFTELLKEYIPGRKLRPDSDGGDDIQTKESRDMKLECLIGSIHFIKDQNRSETKANIIPAEPKIIYDVETKGDYEENKKFFDRKDKEHVKIYECTDTVKEYPLCVVNEFGRKERDIMFRLRNISENDYKKYEKTTDTIKKRIKERCTISDDALDDFIRKLREKTIPDGESQISLVFGIPAKDGYGIMLGQIIKMNKDQKDHYYVMKFVYENFEDASITFFDGTR